MYCFRCGKELARTWRGPGPEPAQEEIAPACGACGYIHYEGPATVAGVIVRREDQILLARPHGLEFPVLVSGYLKAGETVEEAAIRETLEETGLSVSVNHILGSYSGSSLGLNLVLVVCVADVLGGELRRQEVELAGLDWFGIDALPDWPETWPVKHAVGDYVRGFRATRGTVA